MVKIQECSGNMFWGVTLDAGKKYSQTVEQGFHVSMAALDLSGKKSTENVQVMLQHGSSEFLLCTLNDKILQQSLDLNFETGEEVGFSLNGSGLVHLTGYIVMPDDLEGEEFSDSEEEMPSLVDTSDSSIVGNKRKKLTEGNTPKKLKLSANTASMLEEASSEDDEDDEDFSDDFDDDEFPDDDSDVDSEEEEEDEEEDEDEDEEEVNKVIAQKKMQSPKSNKNTPKGKGEGGEKTPKQANKKDEKSNKQGTPAASKLETPAKPLPSENGESKKKKKKKKNKDGDSSLNESTASTPGQTPKTETTPKKRIVAGGTIVEDLKVGHGPEAKPGKMVSVYYVGTLAKNQKRFDSCQSGKPFRFRLSQGEVIKGWDNGVNGMKVGGKRKITVPANQGYGNVKQGPIPPNSSLVFEVELKAVN